MVNRIFELILDFTDNEREPLLRGVVSESRQYTSEPGTFFTPMDSPAHSDNEDESSRTPGNTRGLSKATEVFPPKSLPKLTTEMVRKNCIINPSKILVRLIVFFKRFFNVYRYRTINEEHIY